jgi:hypothetical protein
MSMHHPDASRAAGMLNLALYSVVIPGRRKAAGPESITTIVSMDSGLAPRGAPRNDDGSCLELRWAASSRRWRCRHFVATLDLARLCRASGAIYPRGLIDPLGNCPWPGPWIRAYGAHLLS